MRGLQLVFLNGCSTEPQLEAILSHGVGAVIAMTFRAGVDDPARFSSSKSVGACFGLTPRRYQSGETDRVGAITNAGDAGVRAALYEAAHVMLVRTTRWTPLKAWAMRIAARRGAKRAKVALARKLAAIMHRMAESGYLGVRDRAAAASASSD